MWFTSVDLWNARIFMKKESFLKEIAVRIKTHSQQDATHHADDAFSLDKAE
jgi:hypothetical protein